MASLLNNPIRKALASPFVAGLLISSCVFALCANDAMAQRGGGRGGGGGGAGASRGGGGGSHGGRQASSSVSGGNRSSSGGNRSASTSSANRSGNRSGNTTNRTNNSNRTTNVGSNNNVNVDIDGGYGNGCCRANYPIAAGVAIGAVAGMTAAAVGSYYYGLPSGCGQIVRGGIGYYQCGSAYYQQSMNGDQVVYVSVNP